MIWVIIVFICIISSGCRPKVEAILDQAELAGQVQIEPDYKAVTIPSNIAPLNFAITSHADRYLVKIYGQDGSPILLYTRCPQIRVPIRQWQALLNQNKAGQIWIEVATCGRDRRWRRYEPFAIYVANEPIDRCLVYRLLRPQYNYFKDIGIYQRDIQSFHQSCILHGSQFRDGCLNCHTFLNNRPEPMAIAIRSGQFGSSCIYADDGQLEKLGTRLGHTSWHPSGRLLAFSAFDVRMFFHTARPDVQDVVEMDSLIGYYDLEGRKAGRIPGLADPNRLETQPCWSADGRYLYFACAPKLWQANKQFPPERYAELRYDIQRISYNDGYWGQVETVVSSDRLGKSCLMPRPSPDGRFLLFTACDYGCFPIYQASADLYLMDLNTGQIKALECNSQFSDSWHTWSSNGRWLVFASKRPTGRFTRLYITHIDTDGRASKAFVLPQADPYFYDRFLYAYNLPELIVGPVRYSNRTLVRTIRSKRAIQVDSITSATPVQTQYQQFGQR
ncbi:MAG: hypothetical protein QHH07_05385 [Sedimentisphaerales bacterium]|jgi:hypothetical protein|nr:hypothetical protein [Sedimentisphaerales bacterium]